MPERPTPESKRVTQVSKSVSTVRSRASPPAVGALRKQAQALERSRVGFTGTAEMAPKANAAHEPAWDDRPTPLSERFVADPHGSGVEVLAVALDDRAEAFAAAGTRVPPSKRRVRRSEVRRLIVDFEFVDAKIIDATEFITDEGLVAEDRAMWKLMEAIHAEKVDCVKVASESHGDTLLIVRRALGRTVFERDAAIYAIDRHGCGRRNPSNTRPFEAAFVAGLLAIPAALLVPIVMDFLLEHADETIKVPAVIPAIAVVLAIAWFIRRK